MSYHPKAYWQALVKRPLARLSWLGLGLGFEFGFGFGFGLATNPNPSSTLQPHEGRQDRRQARREEGVPVRGRVRGTPLREAADELLDLVRA